MELLLNEANSTNKNTESKDWFNYKEERYLPSFCVDFPYSPIIISNIEVQGNKGKLYKCDTSFFDLLNSNIFAQYLLYYFPVSEKYVRNEEKAFSFLFPFISSISGGKIINNKKLSEISRLNEDTIYVDFFVSALRISHVLYVGRAFISKDKYVHLLLLKPRHLISKPDYNRFINSFKLLKD